MYYEYYHLDGTEEIPADYKEISFVCLRPDGCLELPSTLSIACRSVAKQLDGFENFPYFPCGFRIRAKIRENTYHFNI